MDINPAVPTKKDTATKEFPRGMLIAWNPALRKEVWRVPQRADWNGGVLATASDLVFQGTAEGNFVAYDVSNGKILFILTKAREPKEKQEDDTRYKKEEKK